MTLSSRTNIEEARADEAGSYLGSRQKILELPHRTTQRVKIEDQAVGNGLYVNFFDLSSEVSTGGQWSANSLTGFGTYSPRCQRAKGNEHSRFSPRSPQSIFEAGSSPSQSTR